MPTQQGNIKLTAFDGHQVVVPVELAMYSGTIKAMMLQQPNSLEIQFPTDLISGNILDEVVRYMRFRKENEACEVGRYEIDPNIVRDLAVAADYLDI